MVKNLKIEIIEKIKENLKENIGYRLFEKKDNGYYFPIYPQKFEEINLGESQIDYILDYFTSSYFLERYVFSSKEFFQELGGHIRHSQSYDKKKDDIVLEKANTATSTIRNYLLENKDWTVDFFKEVSNKNNFEIIQEHLLLYFDGYLCYWDFNDLEKFKKEVEGFRRKYKIDIQSFLKLKDEIDQKYKSLIKDFSIEKVIKDYKFWSLEVIENKLKELENNEKLKDVGQRKNILEIPLTGTYIYIDSLEDFNIFTGQQINTENIYEYLALLELSYKENKLFAYKKIQKEFLIKFKIPDIYGALLKNYIFYEDLNPEDWRLYTRKHIKNKKIFKNEKRYTKNVLCYLLTENEKSRKKLKTILEIKNTEEYKLRNTIGRFVFLEKRIKTEKNAIKELKNLNKLSLYVKIGIAKVSPPIHQRTLQDIRLRKRALNKEITEFKNLKKEILSGFQSIKDAIKFADDFDNQYHEVFGSQNMTSFQNERIHLLWMLADTLEKDLPQTTKIVLEILNQDRKSWESLGDLCRLLKLGSIQKEEYRDFIKAVKSF